MDAKVMANKLLQQEMGYVTKNLGKINLKSLHGALY